MGGSRRGEGRKDHRKTGMTRGNASTRMKTRTVKRNTGGATRGGSHRGKKRKTFLKKRRTLKRIPRKRKKT